MGKKRTNLERSDGGRPLRAALYTRVSTEDQAKEGFSLEAQIGRLRDYCRAREWEVYKEFVDDGYSGRDTRRPAYRAMMEEMDQWDLLLVWKMDRIHRNSRNFMEMMERLKEEGKEFVSVTESLDTSTAMGRFVVDIIQRIAQLESEQIGERVYAGMEQKAQTPIKRLDPNKGVFLGFGHPFGYDYKNGTLVMNEDEAAVVKKIYEMYTAGDTVSKIVTFLNKSEIPTKKRKKWANNTVIKILKNPLYCGYVKWNGILKKGGHDRLIATKQFNEVQKIMLKRRKRGKGNYILLEEV
jgi:DNA invertase Pin-like site-specific DNA recombinase